MRSLLSKSHFVSLLQLGLHWVWIGLWSFSEDFLILGWGPPQFKERFLLSQGSDSVCSSSPVFVLNVVFVVGVHCIYLRGEDGGHGCVEFRTGASRVELRSGSVRDRSVLRFGSCVRLAKSGACYSVLRRRRRFLLDVLGTYQSFTGPRGGHDDNSRSGPVSRNTDLCFSVILTS